MRNIVDVCPPRVETAVFGRRKPDPARYLGRGAVTVAEYWARGRYFPETAAGWPFDL